MKTIAQQLKIKDFPFRIKDKEGNQIYYENSNGFWAKSEDDIITIEGIKYKRINE